MFNTSWDATAGMWYLQKATIGVNGKITDQYSGSLHMTGDSGTFVSCERDTIYHYIQLYQEHLCTIDGPRDWSYACTQMEPFWFNNTVDDDSGSINYQLGFQFWEMHVMPI